MGFKNVVKKVNQIIVVGGDNVVNNKIRIDFRDKLAKLLTTEFIGLRTFEKARFRTTDALVVIAKAFHTIKFREVTRVNAIATVANKLARLVESNFVGLRTFEVLNARLRHFIAIRVFDSTRFVVTPRVDAVATVTETSKYLTSQFTGLRTFEVAARPRTDQTFSVTSDNYANQAVTATNINNPANGLGNNTNTAATATASSSGLAGTTSNTTNFNYVVDFQDVDIANVTPDITSVVLNIEHGAAQAGVAVGAESSYTLRYGFGGATNVDLAAVSNNAKRIQSFDITGAVGDDYGLLNTIRIQAQGSTTSGVGLGAANTVSIYRLWVSFSAEGANAN